MDKDSARAKLRTVLCELYKESTDIRRIAADAGLDTGSVRFDQAIVNIWQNTLIEAENRKGIDKLLDVISEGEYSENTELQTAINDYRNAQGAITDQKHPLKRNSDSLIKNRLLAISGITIALIIVIIYLLRLNNFNLEINVTDSLTNEALSGATVRIEIEGSEERLEQTTDMDGSITIPIPAIYAGKPAVLDIQAAGYEALPTQTIILSPGMPPITVTLTGMPKPSIMRITLVSRKLGEKTIDINESASIPVELLPVKGDEDIEVSVRVLDQYGNMIVSEALQYSWQLCCDDNRNVPPTNPQIDTWTFSPPTDLLTETLTISVSTRANESISVTLPFTITER